MTSSLSDIRAALAKTMVGLGLQVYPRIVDVVNGPAVVIDMAQKTSIEFTGAMAMGGDTYHFDFLILVQNVDIINAQTILDQYVTGQGPKSIREAVFQGIGLEDVDGMALSVSAYGSEPVVASIKMIGALMRVVVTVT